MTAQSTPDSANRPQPYSAMHGGDNGGAQREDSPELLRWRADILMDEMMLGAVDVTAGQTEEPSPGGTASYASATSSERWPTSPFSGVAPSDTPSATTFNADSSGSEPSASAVPEPRMAPDEDEWWRKPFAPEPRPTGDDLPYSAAPRFDSSPWSGQAAPSEPATSDSTEAEPASAKSDLQDGLLRPPSALRSASAASGSTATPSAGDAPGAYASYGGGASRPWQTTRTNLLPRASEGDPVALLREIDELRAEIGDFAPPTHEWSVRSRHLLDKAEYILRHNPEHTAEVEYYLNQVRAIRDRVRQTYHWSQLYYHQLRLYLGAWIGFSALALAGAFFYRQPLAEFYVLLTGAPVDGFGAQQFAFWLAAPLAGALGGSLSALVNMRRYRHLDHGFLDRKYSLRGLLLPIMALVAGLIIYVPFALVAYFLNPTDMVAWALALTPVILAFLYGLFQERLYGASA